MPNIVGFRNFQIFIKYNLEHIVAVIKSLIGIDDVIDSVRVNIQKAYPAYLGFYENFHKVNEHIDSYDNLYCIGRNGQHRYNNTDHSMLTAFCAVKDIKSSGKLGKETVRGVNVENEYHEKK